MKTIAILSDTHGLLRKELLPYLEQADVILHAGDIGAQTIVDTLPVSYTHLCLKMRCDRRGAKYPEALLRPPTGF